MQREGLPVSALAGVDKRDVRQRNAFGFAISGQARGEHYAASKGGLISMMKALSVELARYGVRANAILPGWIDTPMTERTLRWDRFVERVLPRVPIRRWGTGNDFAGIAIYLASDASAYHTGDTFIIDGAYSIF